MGDSIYRGWNRNSVRLCSFYTVSTAAISWISFRRFMRPLSDRPAPFEQVNGCDVKSLCRQFSERKVKRFACMTCLLAGRRYEVPRKTYRIRANNEWLRFYLCTLVGRLERETRDSDDIKVMVGTFFAYYFTLDRDERLLWIAENLSDIVSI